MAEMSLRRAVAGQPGTNHVPGGWREAADEWEIPWFGRLEGASPVRAGNAASKQLQLDIYGEVADALHHTRNAGLRRRESWLDLERGLLAHLQKIWREPDEGMCEIRGSRRHFTYSKVVAWVTFDRAIRSCKQFGVEEPLEQWRATRQEISDDICRHGFDPALGVLRNRTARMSWMRVCIPSCW